MDKITKTWLEKLKQCAIDNDCEEGKKGFCSRWHCRLIYVCEECGWKEELRNAVHTYRDDGTGEDVEACDECPKCGAEIYDIEQA